LHDSTVYVPADAVAAPTLSTPTITGISFLPKFAIIGLPRARMT
jgi:hypothetical protein